MQVTALPLALLGGSAAQVCLAKAPRRLREGALASCTRGAMLRRLKAGGGPIVLAGIASPLLLPAIFREDWARADLVVAGMTPWFMLQFVTSPISAGMVCYGLCVLVVRRMMVRHG